LSPPFTANNQISLYEKIKRDPVPVLPRFIHSICCMFFFCSEDTHTSCKALLTT
jgi:hypothetical protein